MSAVDMIKNVYAAFQRGDIAKAVELCSDDVRYRWPLDGNLSKFSRDGIGKAGFREHLDELAKTFEYHSFEIVSLFGDEVHVAAQISMELTHRGTGRRIAIENAHIWTVRNGEAVAFAEYYDRAAVAAAAAA